MRRNLLAMVMASGLALTCQPAQAGRGDGEDAALADLSIEELLSIHLTTGSFLDLDLRRSPVAMTIIDRDQIDASGARHLGELLEIHVPGFQVMFNKWNGAIWGMRGVAADRTTKVILLVNGHKLNSEARDGAALLTTLGLLDDIERVEVLRGPAGLVHGSGAIAGVINLITRSPDHSTGSLSAGVGTHGGVQVQGLAHAELDEERGLTLSAGYRRDAGFDNQSSRIFGRPSWPGLSEPLSGGVPADGRAWATPGNHRLSADYQAGRLRLYASHTHQALPGGAFFTHDPWPEIEGTPEADAPARWVDGVEQRPDGPYSTTESWGTNRRLYVFDNFLASARWEQPVGEDRLDLELSWVGTTTRILAEGREGYAAPSSSIDSSMGERRYQVSASYLVQRAERLQALLGAEYRLDDLGADLQGYNTHGGEPDHPDITPVVYHSVVGFGEAYLCLHERFQVSGGLRADHHTRTGLVLSPRLAGVWSPSEHHVIKAIVQTSSNNGSVDNYEYTWRHYASDGTLIADTAHLEFDTDPDSEIIPAVTLDDLHGLRPERARSVELTSYHRLMAGLMLTPSVSYTSIDDLFAWNQDLFRVINAGRYDALSVEGDLRLDREPVVAGLSHAWQRPVKVSEGFTTEIPGQQVIDDGDGTYHLEPDGTYEQVQIDAVRDGITQDGEHFLNLATHSTKLFFTWTATGWLRAHGSARVFWGLPGRSQIVAEDEAAGWDCLGVDSSPMVKLNLGLSIDLPGDLRLRVMAYDILGAADSIHAVRWQQMAEPSQRDLYTVDQRSFALQLSTTFD